MLEIWHDMVALGLLVHVLDHVHVHIDADVDVQLMYVCDGLLLTSHVAGVCRGGYKL